MTDQTEKNRRIALQFVDSMSVGALDARLLADDLQWWAPGLGTINRSAFFELTENFNRFIKTPPKMTITAVTAEEDRVAVECGGNGVLKDGRPYTNTYHFLFRIKDGKIVSVREHNDTHYAMSLFGNLAQ